MSAEHPFEWMTVNRTKPRVDRHPLEGHVWFCTYTEIANALEAVPATWDQIGRIGAEEEKNPTEGGDRSSVYRLLHEAQSRL